MAVTLSMVPSSSASKASNRCAPSGMNELFSAANWNPPSKVISLPPCGAADVCPDGKSHVSTEITPAPVPRVASSGVYQMVDTDLLEDAPFRTRPDATELRRYQQAQSQGVFFFAACPECLIAWDG